MTNPPGAQRDQEVALGVLQLAAQKKMSKLQMHHDSRIQQARDVLREYGWSDEQMDLQLGLVKP